MNVRLSDFVQKNVIDMNTGQNLGFVEDFELEAAESSIAITSVIVKEKGGFASYIGKGKEIVIKVSDIAVVGSDSILVRTK